MPMPDPLTGMNHPEPRPHDTEFVCSATAFAPMAITSVLPEGVEGDTKGHGMSSERIVDSEIRYRRLFEAAN